MADKKTKYIAPEQQTDHKKRQEALEKALKQIEKDFGKGAVMKLGEKTEMNIDVIPTGSILLDNALGVQGYPKGRIIEIFGPESSGKTTLALHAAAEAQKAGQTVAFIDAEHALDPVYAKNLGVNIDELLLSQPDTGEQGLEIADALVSSSAVGLVIIDSVAALVPRAEIDGEMGSSHVGLQARLMSQALRKLSGSINRTKTIVIFINQLREKVGVMFGNPETTPGGRALKFYSTIRLEVRRSEQIKDAKDKENPIKGNKTKIKVVKNKVAPPFKTIELDLMYGEGISRTGEIISLSENIGIIKKSGAWFDYNNGEIKVQGRELLKEELKKNPQVMDEIEGKIRTVLSGGEIPKETGSVNTEEYGQSRLDLSNTLFKETNLEDSETSIDK
ncbi:TPA: recombinase RecA [Enterococcus faecalis]|nr:protein RecA [Enterococcus faecalis PF3]